MKKFYLNTHQTSKARRILNPHSGVLTKTDCQDFPETFI